MQVRARGVAGRGCGCSLGAGCGGRWFSLPPPPPSALESHPPTLPHARSHTHAHDPPMQAWARRWPSSRSEASCTRCAPCGCVGLSVGGCAPCARPPPPTHPPPPPPTHTHPPPTRPPRTPTPHTRSSNPIMQPVEWSGRTMEQKRVNTIGLDEVYTGGRQQDRLALDVEVGGLGGWRVGVGCVGACVGVVRVGGGARGERAGAGRAPGAPATPPRHSHAHTLSLLRWRSLARTSLGGCSHPRKRSARCATGGFGVWLGGGEGEGGLGERLAARARPRALLMGPPHRPPPPPPLATPPPPL